MKHYRMWVTFRSDDDAPLPTEISDDGLLMDMCKLTQSYGYTVTAAQLDEPPRTNTPF